MSIGLGYALVLFAAHLPTSTHHSTSSPPFPKPLTLFARSSLLPKKGSAAVYNYFDIMVIRSRFNGAGADGWWIIRASGSCAAQLSNFTQDSFAHRSLGETLITVVAAVCSCSCSGVCRLGEILLLFNVNSAENK